MKIAVATIAASICALGSAQTIVQFTERALPGEPINIMGDGLTGDVTVNLTQMLPHGAVGATVTAPIIAQQSGVVQAQVPTSLAIGVWGLSVTTPDGTSNTVYINNPEIYFVDTYIQSPGGTFTVYGRNLQVLGSNQVGEVDLVAQDGARLVCPVVNAGPYSLTVQVPTNAIPGTNFNIAVSNGSGSGNNWVTSPTRMSVIDAKDDPFNLGVWWGQKFTFADNVYNVTNDRRLKKKFAVGDGVTEDLEAIQNAIKIANKAGGGVVYLPAGTYLIDSLTTGLQLLSNVVLMGDGAGQTILQFGNYWDSDTAPKANVYPIRAWWGQTTFGLEGLTIQNVNSSETPSQTIMLASPNGISTFGFVHNCDLQLGVGNPMSGVFGTNLLVENNTIETLNTLDGPLTFGGCVSCLFQNNVVSFRNGRLRFQYSTNLVFQNNTVNRDNSFMTLGSVETGAVELSSARLAVVQNNVIAGIGPTNPLFPEGEMVNCQRSSTPDEEDLGTVTSATKYTLSNKDAEWTTDSPFTIPGYGQFSRACVAIIAGKGAGQWSMISSNREHKLNLQSAWRVIPDSTSTYTIGWWAADRLLILNNQMSNSNIGVQLWEGANDCVVDGNTLTDSGKILIRATDTLHDCEVINPGPMKGRRHAQAWGNWISNNTVSDTSGLVGAAISAYSLNVDGTSFGNLVFGTEIRSNTVNAYTPTLVTLSDEAVNWEGYWNFAKTNSTGPNDPYCNMGTLLINNTSANLAVPFNTPGASLFQILTDPVLP